MPNWCENTLTISARNEEGRKEIAKFSERAPRPDPDEDINTKLSLDNFMPMPLGLLDTKSPCDDDAENELPNH